MKWTVCLQKKLPGSDCVFGIETRTQPKGNKHFPLTRQFQKKKMRKRFFVAVARGNIFTLDLFGSLSKDPRGLYEPHRNKYHQKFVIKYKLL